MQLHVNQVQSLQGFAARNFPKGSYGWVLASSSLTSDEPNFYRYVEQISTIYLNGLTYLLDGKEHLININDIHSFLILVHHDLTADIYINDLPIEIKMLSKRSIQKGTLITYNDIADICELRFTGIDIHESDSVVCCFKVGWKFGLYFNFVGQNHGLDIASVYTSLGKLYRYLTFQHVYRSLESETHFGEMVKDGWFPFIEILGEEYKTLASTYQNEKFNYDGKVKILLDKFDESRVKRITEKWWEKPIFQEKQQLLQAGIDAFLQGNESGHINCIKNLLTEIEGIMRLLYFRDTGKGSRIGQKELIDHLGNIGKRLTENDDRSLLLPQQFLEYLIESVFANFNLETGTIDLSRHSAAHGVATAKDYTGIKALQTLLALDQICFYLPSRPDGTED